MTNRPYELLVHTTAPLVRNEALYRSLASAYFEFTTPNSLDAEDEAESQSYVVAQDMAESNADSQPLNSQSQSQPQHDTLQAFMSPSGAESWTPDSQFEISQKRTYLTRSRLATSSAAPSATAPPASVPPTSQASFIGTFTSTLDGALDGMMSPRFRMPAAMAGPAYLWDTQSSGQPESTGFGGMTQATPRTASQGESSTSFLPPPSTVADSMTQGYNPVPAWSTSQVVMESFLSHFQTQSSHSTSSPSVRRSQRSSGTAGSLASSAPRGAQMPADSQNGASNQSSSMRSSIRSSLLDDGRKAPQVSPPKPRRQRPVSPGNAQPVVSPAANTTPASGQAQHQQQSSTPSAADPVSPAQSHEDEQYAATTMACTTARGNEVSRYVPRQYATPTPLPIPNRAVAAVTATPTPPDTPLRDLRKRRASNTSLEGGAPRPLKRPTTHASRLQQVVSEVPHTPAAAAVCSAPAAPQVPFTGSFKIPVPHPLSKVRNILFDENISRISDTPPNVTSSDKLPPLEPAASGNSKTPLPLNTSISLVPDTPTPAPNPTHIKPLVPPSSSAIPLPSAPPSSAITVSKPAKAKRLSTSLPTTYSIHPPSPLPSAAPLPSFITPFLHKIANQMSYSRYDPTIVTRPLRKDERGYWTFSLPDDVGGWNMGMREETWSYLEKIVGKGRAGWGVHVYRALWQGKEDDEGKGKGKEGGGEQGWKGEEWRVYCWGEIVGQVYLLLFLASSRKIRGLGARWVDGEGKVVVRMESERRVKA